MIWLVVLWAIAAEGRLVPRTELAASAAGSAPGADLDEVAAGRVTLQGAERP